MEDRPMYLGLIQVVNTHHEHRNATEHAEGDCGSVLQRLVQWLGPIFRSGSTPADL
jgi:hypothetical protein